MNVESFENEIAKLENQLQDAIAALRALKDIRATFQDMQPRYERLKQLTDEAARLPAHYAEQFEAARRRAEVRLTQLEAQLQQQQTDWQAAITQDQQVHQALQQRLQVHKTALETLATQQQQNQAALQAAITQSVTEIQDSITLFDERASSANASLKAFIEEALQDQARQLREEWTAQFKKALVTGLLAGAIALGAWITVLSK